MDILGLIFAVSGAFYAGYQRGRRVQTVQDSRATTALVDITEKLSEEQLSSLGRELKKIALDGLRSAP